MIKKKRIALFSGNRAEYGLQYPLLKAMQDHKQIETLLIISGAHLDPYFGKTVDEIERDGFKISAEIKIDLNQDDLFATTKAIGHGVVAICEALQKLKPDMMVVYGDRFESFSSAIASTQMNIPTAHIEGGDLTEGGALDDSIRHAITKLSHLHFTTNLQATHRVLAMGEEEWRVHTVGLPAIDLIRQGHYAKPGEVCDRFQIDLNRPLILFTQHSIATECHKAGEQINASLLALERCALQGNQVIITYPNNDAGGRAIIETLQKWQEKKIPHLQIHRSLGRHFYHGVLALNSLESAHVVCVGNSSSGIKETLAFHCPAVNIGSRQDGRLRGGNVVDVGYNTDEIYNAIQFSLTNTDFRQKCRQLKNPYGEGLAGKKIVEVLTSTVIDEKLIRKKMVTKSN